MSNKFTVLLAATARFAVVFLSRYASPFPHMPKRPRFNRIITIIDGWYLTSRQEDKWRTLEGRITFE
jgi:hypothetical protein